MFALSPLVERATSTSCAETSDSILTRENLLEPISFPAAVSTDGLAVNAKAASPRRSSPQFHHQLCREVATHQRPLLAVCQKKRLCRRRVKLRRICAQIAEYFESTRRRMPA